MLKPFVLSALALASIAQANRIVVNNDEWTFANFSFLAPGSGYAAPNDGARFAINVADWLTEESADRNVLNLSQSASLANAGFNSTLMSAGYSVTQGSAAPVTLAGLLAYDAIFLGQNGVSTSVLIDYVNAGGNVYLMGGVGVPGEDAIWDPFLNAFGLDFGEGYNGVGSPYLPADMSIPVSGSHPILAGIDHLQMGNGNTIYDINASDTRGQIVASYNGMGILAVYDGNGADPATVPAAVPEPGTLALMGLGLISMAAWVRRRT